MKNCRTITVKKLRLSMAQMAGRSYAADLMVALTDTVTDTELFQRVLIEKGALDEITVTVTMTILSTIWMIPAIL
jgi:hypothetical protein